jgi:cell division septation protein DedD
LKTDNSNEQSNSESVGDRNSGRDRAGEISSGSTLPQTGFEVVKGLVYTVQVGVYSKPVTAGQLFNIQPLYFDRTAKGLYRYSTGVYNNLPDANKAKGIAVQIGISDAFVTAYFEGKRISMEQAAGLVSKNGQSVFIEREDMNRMPGTLKTVATGQPRKTEEIPARSAEVPVKPEETKVSETAKEAVNIEYRVQIGVFRNEVPVEVMNKFLSIATMGITSNKTAEGLTVYSVGKFKDFGSAEKLKNEVVGQGIPDAFVAPYNNGKRISVEEARKLENR